MAATVIDGKAVAAGILEGVGREVASLKVAGKPMPGLAVVLVGEDPASQVYVGSKAKRTKEAGMVSIERKLPASASQDELLEEVKSLNQDPKVHGILVQLPLPSQIDSTAVLDAIDPAKDVDGFHVINAGRLATGRPSLVPCTPKGCMILLEREIGDLSGARAVVIGRSNIVGKPMTQLLLAANATVTVAHSRTGDLPALCREADILVAATGRPEMVRGDWVRPGAVVIDVGINRVPGDEKPRLVGDVAYAEAVEVAGAITPVPGGVGPMTIACLLANTLEAYQGSEYAGSST